MDKLSRCAERTAMEPSSGSQVVQQPDGNQGDSGTDNCLHQAAHEFVVTGQREGEYGGNAENNDDELCARTNDKVLYADEGVVPRQDGLTCGPTVAGRDESCGCTADGREKKSAGM